VNPIVGQWTAKPECQQVEGALAAAGLRAAAAPILADFFPDATPEQLAKKKDICEGAPPPVEHSHFFTADGLFGSLDQDQRQVDDGTYLATVSDLYICDSSVPRCTSAEASGHFSYVISSDQLSLTSVITSAEKSAARSSPLEFNDAGWMVSVAYAGHPWKRTECSRCE
jgi:hypothetical protein